MGVRLIFRNLNTWLHLYRISLSCSSSRNIILSSTCESDSSLGDTRCYIVRHSLMATQVTYDRSSYPEIQYVRIHELDETYSCASISALRALTLGVCRAQGIK